MNNKQLQARITQLEKDLAACRIWQARPEPGTKEELDKLKKQLKGAQQ